MSKIIYVVNGYQNIIEVEGEIESIWYENDSEDEKEIIN